MDASDLRRLLQEHKITWSQYDAAWETMSANGIATWVVSTLCWAVAIVCLVSTLKPWRVK